MALKIWLNDGLVDEKDAKISVFDHGLLYGDGVFEGIRVYSSKIFELGAHLKRLYESAKVIRLNIGMPIKDLAKATEETVRANNIVDGYIRLVITRGVGTLGINPFTCEKSQIIMISHNKKSMEFSDMLFGVTMGESGVSKLVSVDIERLAKKDDSQT